jgi:hypothetical protein
VRELWLRLLWRQVAALVREKHGNDYLKDRQAKAEGRTSTTN